MAGLGIGCQRPSIAFPLEEFTKNSEFFAFRLAVVLFRLEKEIIRTGSGRFLYTFRVSLFGLRFMACCRPISISIKTEEWKVKVKVKV